MALQYIQTQVERPTLGLAAAGTLAFLSLPILKFLYLECRSSSLPRYNHGPNPAWALVTGASDGIGFGFASELAQQGFNVILHGRNQTKLDGLLDKLTTQFPNRQFRTLVVNAANRSAWYKLDDFAQALTQEQLNLTVLVNNVGTGAGKDGRAFVAADEIMSEDISAIIDTNTVFPAQITRVLLPILKKKEPSLIINIGSGAGKMGLPYLATYSATKAFNFIWSTSLRRELLLDKADIEVLSVNVGKVQSAGTRMVPTSIFIPSSAAFAKSTLQKTGCGRDEVCGYWGHAVQFAIFGLLPWFGFNTDKIVVKLAQTELDLQAKAT